jgi:hypothetical protein
MYGKVGEGSPTTFTREHLSQRTAKPRMDPPSRLDRLASGSALATHYSHLGSVHLSPAAQVSPTPIKWKLISGVSPSYQYIQSPPGGPTVNTGLRVTGLERNAVPFDSFHLVSLSYWLSQ